jgi:hypothetical protein
MLFAHELGHLVLHQRLRDPDARPDPLSRLRLWRRRSLRDRALQSADLRGNASRRVRARARGAQRHGLEDMVRQRRGHGTVVRGALRLCPTSSKPNSPTRCTPPRRRHDPSASRKDVSLTAAQLAAARLQVRRQSSTPVLGPERRPPSSRIRFLLEERGARPADILALTFSNEAAQSCPSESRSPSRRRRGRGQRAHVSRFCMEFCICTATVGIAGGVRAPRRRQAGRAGQHPLGQCRRRLIDLRVPLETATRVVEHINFASNAHRLTR